MLCRKVLQDATEWSPNRYALAYCCERCWALKDFLSGEQRKRRAGKAKLSSESCGKTSRLSALGKSAGKIGLPRDSLWRRLGRSWSLKGANSWRSRERWCDSGGGTRVWMLGPGVKHEKTVTRTGLCQRGTASSKFG